MDERLQLLTSMPVFGALSETTASLIARLAESVTMTAGDHFFHEGDDSQSMYVLEAGRVEIYKTWQGASKRLRTMQAGDCFGEMALIDLFPRSASVRALEPCTALRIDGVTLQALYQHDMEQFALLQMNIARELSRRLRQQSELLFRAAMGETLPGATLEELA